MCGSCRSRSPPAGPTARSATRSATCWAAGLPCSPRWPVRPRAAMGRWARSPPRRWPPWSAAPFSARRRCCCSASTASSCRSVRRCGGSAWSSGNLRKGKGGRTMRACQPARDGYVERDGVRVFWERYGEGEPTFLLPPTYEIVHSRSWKGQIPYLSRHGRVVTFDPRGNGRSDRPRDYDACTRHEVAADALAVMDAPRTPPRPPRACAPCPRHEVAADALAVMDATGTQRAIVVAWCDMGDSLILA